MLQLQNHFGVNDRIKDIPLKEHLKHQKILNNHLNNMGLGDLTIITIKALERLDNNSSLLMQEGSVLKIKTFRFN